MGGSGKRFTRVRWVLARACMLGAPLAAAAVVALVVVNTTAAPTAATEITTNATNAVASTETTVVQAPTPEVTDTTVAAGTSVDYSAAELEFVRLLNEYRASNGLEPLLLSDIVTLAADRHDSDMIKYDFLNHYTGNYCASNGRDKALKGKRSDYFATGTDPAERMVACGYDYKTIMGENIAAGQQSAADALASLKASPTHNANLLNADFKVVGVALVYDSGSDFDYYWTTDFGGYIDTTAHALTTEVASSI